MRVRAVCVWALLGCSSGSPTSNPDAGLATTVAESALAKQHVATLRAIERGVAERFELVDDALRPRFSRHPRGEADVRLALQANAESSVTDVATGKSARFALLSTKPVEGEVGGGLVLYRGALDGADVVQRPTELGTEDYVFFASRPASEQLRYRVNVGAFAGLRLVSNTFEMLDEHAVARLRVAPPYVVDAKGARHEARLSVAGCSYSDDPRAETIKNLVAPGAAECELSVTWSAGLAYPLVVDPFFSTTASMATPRKQHGALLFATVGGNLMYVAGGIDAAGNFLNTTEWCDADANCPAFMGTTALKTARGEFPEMFQHLGDIIIIGGRNSAGTVNTVEYLAGGTWTALTMTSGRASSRSAQLGSGNILITGGASAGAAASLNTTELYNATTHTLAAAAPMGSARWGHTATTLPSGQVLVTGGNNGAAVLATAELWNGSAWSPVGGSMANPRIRHRAQYVAGPAGTDGVLISGGRDAFPTGTVLTSATWYAISGGSLSAAAPMLTARELFTLDSLGARRAVAIGGGVIGSAYTSAGEVYDRATNTWTSVGALAAGRGEHQSASTGESIFVSGGTDNNTTMVRYGSVERFAFLATGGACTDGRLCVTGNCVDGVCCQTASCTGTMKCNNAATKGRCTSALGATCAGNGDCDSGRCVDGVCCDGPCSGKCEACSATLKGAGANGVCGPIVAGADPQSECADEAATNACGTDGACDGARACRFYPATKVCVAAACVGNVAHPADRCSGAGACVNSPPVDCGLARCAAGACPATCTTDAQCVDGAHCAAGKCVADSVKGGPCTRVEQCPAGLFCADGVCCDQACTGPCKSCKQADKADGSANGTCGNVKDNTPEPACSAAPPCGNTGTCNATGGCKLAAKGSKCGATPIVCEGNLAKGQGCDGLGMCVNDPSGTDCTKTGYTCKAMVGCLGACTATTDCASGYTCVDNACKVVTPEGSPCTTPAECGSGFCVDGVCCDKACDGQCESCNKVAGKCLAVTGAPPAGKPACGEGTPGEPCSKQACDGVAGDKCAGFVGAEVECKPASCADSVASLPATCSGGTCGTPATSACGAWACKGPVCGAAPCASDTDCAPKFRCDPVSKDCIARDANSCSPDGLSVVAAADGALSPCTPFVCQAGKCKESCGASLDCAPGFICDPSSGRCNAPPANDDGGGCGCQTPGSSPNTPWLLAAALALALSRVSRRARS